MDFQDISKEKLGKRAGKRLGRGPGSGRGKTAGRGQKGYGARSGMHSRHYHEGGQMPLIRRIPKTHRYHVTPLGIRAALFLTRSYARLLRPGLANIHPTHSPPAPTPIQRIFQQLDVQIDKAWSAQQVAA